MYIYMISYIYIVDTQKKNVSKISDPSPHWPVSLSDTEAWYIYEEGFDILDRCCCLSHTAGSQEAILTGKVCEFQGKGFIGNGVTTVLGFLGKIWSFLETNCCFTRKKKLSHRQMTWTSLMGVPPSAKNLQICLFNWVKPVAFRNDFQAISKKERPDHSWKLRNYHDQMRSNAIYLLENYHYSVIWTWTRSPDHNWKFSSSRMRSDYWRLPVLLIHVALLLHLADLGIDRAASQWVLPNCFQAIYLQAPSRFTVSPITDFLCICSSRLLRLSKILSTFSGQFQSPCYMSQLPSYPLVI